LAVTRAHVRARTCSERRFWGPRRIGPDPCSYSGHAESHFWARRHGRFEGGVRALRRRAARQNEARARPKCAADRGTHHFSWL
jgi:hypothetical protein